MKTILLMIAVAMISACSSGTAGSNKAGVKAMPFGELAAEFAKSKKETNDKYKDKPITVQAYPASAAPIMPTSKDDNGILSITAPGVDLLYLGICSFPESEKQAFSEVDSRTPITLTGTYDDDDLAIRIKNCRIVKE